MKKRPLSLAVAAALLSLSPPCAEAAPAPLPRPKKRDGNEAIEKMLLGTWKGKVGPTFETEWTFQKGGVILSSNGQPTGRWAIEKKHKRVLITWNKKDWDSLTLPLDERESLGKSSHDPNWRVVAVKLRGPD